MDFEPPELLLDFVFLALPFAPIALTVERLDFF